MGFQRVPGQTLIPDALCCLKKIGILKQEGSEIESKTRRGCRLLDIPDLMLAHKIRNRLHTSVLDKRDIRRYVSTD